MAKISTYDNASPVALNDKVIGTSVDGSPSNVTKNFLISDILGLATAATLDDVLTAGNSSAQSMVLTGSATIGLLRVDNMKMTNLSVYADNIAALAGGLVSSDVYRTSGGDLKIVF